MPKIEKQFACDEVGATDYSAGGQSHPVTASPSRSIESNFWSVPEMRDDFDFKGGQGSIHRFKFEGEPYLVKFPDAKSASSVAALEREARAYERIGPHVNIAETIGMREINGKMGLVFKDQNCIDLNSFISRIPEKLEESEHSDYIRMVRSMAADLLSGLSAVHDAGLVHGDLKPKNVLLSLNDMRLKIIDFGMSSDIGSSERFHEAGTSMFVPPEWHIGGGGQGISEKFDSFGAAQILSGLKNGLVMDRFSKFVPINQIDGGEACPFYNEELAKECISTGGYASNYPAKKGFFPRQDDNVKLPDVTNFGQMISDLIQPDPAKRLSPRDCLNRANFLATQTAPDVVEGFHGRLKELLPRAAGQADESRAAEEYGAAPGLKEVRPRFSIDDGGRVVSGAVKVETAELQQKGVSQTAQSTPMKSRASADAHALVQAGGPAKDQSRSEIAKFSDGPSLDGGRLDTEFNQQYAVKIPKFLRTISNTPLSAIAAKVGVAKGAGVSCVDPVSGQLVHAKGFRVIEVPNDRYGISEKYINNALRAYSSMALKIIDGKFEGVGGDKRNNLSLLIGVAEQCREMVEFPKGGQKVYALVNKENKSDLGKGKLEFPVIYGVAICSLGNKSVTVDTLVSHPLTQVEDGNSIRDQLISRMGGESGKGEEHEFVALSGGNFRLRGVGTTLVRESLLDIGSSHKIDLIFTGVVNPRSDSITRKLIDTSRSVSVESEPGSVGRAASRSGSVVLRKGSRHSVITSPSIAEETSEPRLGMGQIRSRLPLAGVEESTQAERSPTHAGDPSGVGGPAAGALRDYVEANVARVGQLMEDLVRPQRAPARAEEQATEARPTEQGGAAAEARSSAEATLEEHASKLLKSLSEPFPNGREGTYDALGRLSSIMRFIKDNPLGTEAARQVVRQLLSRPFMHKMAWMDSEPPYIPSKDWQELDAKLQKAILDQGKLQAQQSANYVKLLHGLIKEGALDAGEVFEALMKKPSKNGAPYVLRGATQAYGNVDYAKALVTLLVDLVERNPNMSAEQMRKDLLKMTSSSDLSDYDKYHDFYTRIFRDGTKSMQTEGSAIAVKLLADADMMPSKKEILDAGFTSNRASKYHDAVKLAQKAHPQPLTSSREESPKELSERAVQEINFDRLQQSREAEGISSERSDLRKRTEGAKDQVYCLVDDVVQETWSDTVERQARKSSVNVSLPRRAPRELIDSIYEQVASQPELQKYIAMLTHSTDGVAAQRGVAQAVVKAESGAVEEAAKHLVAAEVDSKVKKQAGEAVGRNVEEAVGRHAEDAVRRRTEEEARRQAEEAARRQAEEEARRQAEVEARRQAEVEARREAEVAARREVETARKAIEEETRRAFEREMKRLEEVHPSNVSRMQDADIQMRHDSLKDFNIERRLERLRADTERPSRQAKTQAEAVYKENDKQGTKWL